MIKSTACVRTQLKNHILGHKKVTLSGKQAGPEMPVLYATSQSHKDDTTGVLSDATGLEGPEQKRGVTGDVEEDSGLVA